MMDKGWRDVVRVHEVDPLRCSKLRIVREVVGTPLLPGKFALTTFSVGSLETNVAGYYRVLIGFCPGGSAAPFTLLTNLNDVQLHSLVRDGHVTVNVPAVELAGHGICVPAINGDPAVERPGFVDKGGR